MKKINLILLLSLFFNTTIFAQNLIVKKPIAAVLNIDTEGIQHTPEQIGNVVRLELDKLGLYEVMDKYDVSYLVQKNGLNISNCYGKICLQEIGTQLGADKMLTGSIEGFGEQIVVTLKIIDITSNSVEKSSVQEFLFLPNQIKNMLQVTLNSLFSIESEDQLIKELTKKDALASENNMPYKDNIKANGTRVGFTIFTGEARRVLSEKKNIGGFDAFPVMFQFGYQFEKQYLNEGRLQALFEFVPLITGLEQGFFIPSFTIMNGLRDNKTGLEFAFGPTFSGARIAEGYYETINGEQVWKLSNEWNNQGIHPEFEDRMDSRGNFKIKTNFVFTVGKTFTSGNLNIPVNAFVIPEKDNFRFGVSFGYNSVKDKFKNY